MTTKMRMMVVVVVVVVVAVKVVVAAGVGAEVERVEEGGGEEGAGASPCLWWDQLQLFL
jgi:hypothetical protein